MTDAVIIPFPAPRPRALEITPRTDNMPGARLQTALQGLHAALTEQAQAVAEWRFAMAELGVGVAALRHGLTEYEGSLDQLDGRLGGLRDTALALDATADRGFAHAP